MEVVNIFFMAITFKDKRFLVLGLGATGVSMANYLISRGSFVALTDDHRPGFELQKILGNNSEAVLFDDKQNGLEREVYDYLAISPGVPMTHPLVRRSQMLGIPVLGDIELFFNEKNKLKKSKLVGITGSNGKTTVTEMVGAICGFADVSCTLGGNIGKPVLDILGEIESGATLEPEVLVLELSSFQLDNSKSHALDVAVLLNITEDHLDRYDSFQKYVDSKISIFDRANKKVINQKDFSLHGFFDNSFVTFGANEISDGKNWGLRRDGNVTVISRGAEILLDVAKLKTIGAHNIENCMAAAAIADSLGIKFDSIAQALQRFSGLPHRVDLIMEFKGVKFIDDSKGTNVGATVAALNGYCGTAIPILGGDGKGQNFWPLREAVAKGCRGVILMGRDKHKIADTLDGIGLPIEFVSNMDEAVQAAYQTCREGDVVLLSPACASFDMFKDYKDRSNAFKISVKSLARSL